MDINELKNNEKLLLALLKEQNIKEEKELFNKLRLELNKLDTMKPKIHLDELNNLKIALMFDIYSLYNVMELPQQLQKWVDEKNKKHDNLDEFRSKYWKLVKIADLYNLTPNDVKVIPKLFDIKEVDE